MVEKTLSLKKLIQICSLSLLDNKMIKSNCNEKYPTNLITLPLRYFFLKCNSLPCITQKLYLVTVTSVKYHGTSHHCTKLLTMFTEHSQWDDYDFNGILSLAYVGPPRGGSTACEAIFMINSLKEWKIHLFWKLKYLFLVETSIASMLNPALMKVQNNESRIVGGRLLPETFWQPYQFRPR